jgi:hypothetical protein
MYRDLTLWKKIQHRILVDGISIKQVAKATGISRPTIRKMLDNPSPKSYSARSRRIPTKQTPRAPTCVARVFKRGHARDSAFEWMRAVLQGENGLTTLRNDVGDLRDVNELVRRVYEAGYLSETVLW